MNDDWTPGCDAKADVPDDQKGRQYDVFEEVAVVAQYLRHVGVLATIEERVRFARRRFGHYDLIDFVVVLLGYAVSRERTLEAFYECVHPFATCIGYLGHPFEKETPWAFITRLFLVIRWYSAIDRGREMVLMHKRKQSGMGIRPSWKVCTGCRRDLPKTSSDTTLLAGWTSSTSWTLAHVVLLQATF
jgi:hypothetical protein